MTFSDNRVPDVEATGSEYSEAVTDKGDTDRRGKHAVVKALGWKGEVRKSLASEEGVKLDRLRRRFRVPAAVTTASIARQRRAGVAKIRAGMTLYSGERERKTTHSAANTRQHSTWNVLFPSTTRPRPRPQLLGPSKSSVL